MVRRWWLSCVFGLTACYQPALEDACAVTCTSTCPGDLVCGSDGRCHAPGSGTCSGVTTDASTDLDSRLDGSPMALCAGTNSSFLEVLCYAVDTELLVSASTEHLIDTSNNEACTEIHTYEGRNLCVVAFQRIDLHGKLRATGNRPLVLWSASTITITGSLDVSSVGAAGTQRGAGGNWPSCVAGNGESAVVVTDGGGGGAGGTHATRGAYGAPSQTHAGGTAQEPVAITAIRGGCQGGRGGDHANTSVGLGGSGGGAVYLMAGTSIEVSGFVNASGGGATTTGARTGGSGGGSGGMIVLDAPSVRFGTALLLAVGGSGGAGGGLAKPGAMGTQATAVAYATGPAGTDHGGSGGTGSNPLVPQLGGVGLTDNVNDGGGGGGGGGAGCIRVFGEVQGTPESRPPLVL